MKLLFLCNLSPRKLGAFEDFIVGVGEGLAPGGDSLVCVFAEKPCDEVSEKFDQCGVRWHTVNSWNDEKGVHPWAICLPLLRILRIEKPDIVAVHFGNELPLTLIILLSKIIGYSNIKWVWHQRQQINKPSAWLQRHLSRIRILSLFCHHFVALYHGGKDSLQRRGIKSNHVSVIYNGVPPYIARRSPGWLRDELGIPKDADVITNVSSLIRRKRIDLTIQAFAKLYCDDENSCDRILPHLILVGEGPECDNLRKLSESKDVSYRVHFMGRRNDVREIMSESDLLVMSSEAEACPWSIIEAMSVGLPCVSTDAGAARELIDESITGKVVNQGDLSALVICIREILDNTNIRNAMIDASSQRWTTQFTKSRVISEHCRLYRRLFT